MKEQGGSQADAAKRLGVSAPYLSQILSGARNPGLHAAHAIERATKEWPDGPIVTEEWDAGTGASDPEAA